MQSIDGLVAAASIAHEMLLLQHGTMHEAGALFHVVIVFSGFGMRGA